MAQRSGGLRNSGEPPNKVLNPCRLTPGRLADKMRFVHMILLIVVVSWARPSAATSCRGLDDHYVLSCNHSNCAPLFRAVEVPAYGTCGRVMKVESFPEWANEPIAEVIRESDDLPLSPVVVSVEAKHRFPAVPRSAEDFHRFQSWDEPQVLQHAERPKLVRAWYERRSSATARRTYLLLARDIAAYAGTMAVLVGSFAWLARGLRSRSRKGQTRMLLRALGIKACLMILGIAILPVFFLVPPFLVLLAPTALVFAIFDVTAFWTYRKRDSNGPA
jgi:hypothetical protein